MNLKRVPVFEEPFRIPLSEYEVRLVEHAKSNRSYTADLLQKIGIVAYIEQHLDWSDNITAGASVQLLATGSDGRDEKATFVAGRINGNSSRVPSVLSDVEIPSALNVIAILSLQRDLEKNILTSGLSVEEMECKADKIIDDHRREIMEMMERELMPLGLFEQMEVKSAHSVYPSGYLDSEKDSWPSRIFDTVALTEHAEILDRVVRQRYVQELQLPKRAKALRKRELDRAKEYEKVCTGQKRVDGALPPGAQFFSQKVGKVRHFDLEAGEAYYDRPAHVSSFKYGPLRTVQMHVSSCIIQLLHNRKSDAHSIITIAQKIPRSISNKLRFLHEENLLPGKNGNTPRLIENYQFFLRLYHQSEWNRAAHNEDTLVYAETQDERTDVKERLQDTVSDVNALLR